MLRALSASLQVLPPSSANGWALNTSVHPEHAVWVKDASFLQLSGTLSASCRVVHCPYKVKVSPSQRLQSCLLSDKSTKLFVPFFFKYYEKAFAPALPRYLLIPGPCTFFLLHSSNLSVALQSLVLLVNGAVTLMIHCVCICMRVCVLFVHPQVVLGVLQDHSCRPDWDVAIHRVQQKAKSLSRRQDDVVTMTLRGYSLFRLFNVWQTDLTVRR